MKDKDIFSDGLKTIREAMESSNSCDELLKVVVDAQIPMLPDYQNELRQNLPKRKETSIT